MSGIMEMHESMINFFSFFNKIPNWLRWILLIPVLLVSSIAITLIIRLIYFISAEPTYQWFVGILVNIFSVSGSIVITVIMAPIYRVVVGIVLAVLVFIMIGMSFAIDIMFYYIEWAYLLEQLGLTIGAVLALLYVIYGVKPYEDKENFIGSIE